MQTLLLSLLSGMFGALFVPVLQYVSERIKRRRAWSYYRVMLDKELNLLWFEFTAIFPTDTTERVKNTRPLTTDIWNELWPRLPEIAPKRSLWVLGEAYATINSFKEMIIKGSASFSMEHVDAMRARLIDAINELGVSKYDESEGMKGYLKKYPRKMTTNDHGTVS